MTTVGFLKVLTSNAITWKNIDLPPHVKDKIVKELGTANFSRSY